MYKDGRKQLGMVCQEFRCRNDTVNKKELKQMDEGKEGPMEKQKDGWTVSKRNARNNS